MTVFLGTLWRSIKEVNVHSCLMGKRKLLCVHYRGIRTDFTARGKTHGFSRVSAQTWVIFSSYSEDGPSKHMFVQRSQDSSLIARDTSRFSLMLGRAIETPLEVKRETQSPFPFVTLILGFLSTFKRSQTSSPFEALILCAS